MPLGIQKLQTAKETAARRSGRHPFFLWCHCGSLCWQSWTLCHWQRRKGNIQKQCKEGDLWNRETDRALGYAVLKYPCVKAALIYFWCCVILFLSSWGSLFCVIIQCTGCCGLSVVTRAEQGSWAQLQVVSWSPLRSAYITSAYILLTKACNISLSQGREEESYLMEEEQEIFIYW